MSAHDNPTTGTHTQHTCTCFWRSTLATLQLRTIKVHTVQLSQNSFLGLTWTKQDNRHYNSKYCDYIEIYPSNWQDYRSQWITIKGWRASQKYIPAHHRPVSCRVINGSTPSTWRGADHSLEQWCRPFTGESVPPRSPVNLLVQQEEEVGCVGPPNALWPCKVIRWRSPRACSSIGAYAGSPASMLPSSSWRQCWGVRTRRAGIGGEKGEGAQDHAGAVGR
jgi:hypothetical protein